MARFPNVSKEARQSPGGRTSKGGLRSPSAMAMVAPVVNPHIDLGPSLPQVQQTAPQSQELISTTEVTIVPGSISEIVPMPPKAPDHEVHPITQTAPEILSSGNTESEKPTLDAPASPLGQKKIRSNSPATSASDGSPLRRSTRNRAMSISTIGSHLTHPSTPNQKIPILLLKKSHLKIRPH